MTVRHPKVPLGSGSESPFTGLCPCISFLDHQPCKEDSLAVLQLEKLSGEGDRHYCNSHTNKYKWDKFSLDIRWRKTEEMGPVWGIRERFFNKGTSEPKSE